MIEVKASKATGVQIEGHGNPLEQAEDIINIISAVHNGFLMAQDILGATLFHAVVVKSLSDPDSPIWTSRNAEGYATRVPKRQTPPRPVRVPA